MSEPVQNQDKEIAPVNWSVTAVLGLTFIAAVTVVPWYGIVHGYNGWGSGLTGLTMPIRR